MLPDGPGCPPPSAGETAAFTAHGPSKAHVWLADLVGNTRRQRFLPLAPAAPDCDWLVDDDEVSVRMFPGEAAEETEHWLALTNTFLYEYAQSILDGAARSWRSGRRAPRRAKTSRARMTSTGSTASCTTLHVPHEPSVPFRRVARDRIRISIDHDGAAVVYTESTLRAREDTALALLQRGALAVARPPAGHGAHGRRRVRARKPERQLEHVHARARAEHGALPGRRTTRCAKRCACGEACEDRRTSTSISEEIDVSLEHTRMEIFIDGVITLTALGSRIAVLAANWLDFVADGVGYVTVFEVVGISASFLHVLLRAGAFEIDLEHESPLTKLAGPMSDLRRFQRGALVFADPPLLTTHDGRFAAVGRMLIAILISISVFSRCIFAAVICARCS